MGLIKRTEVGKGIAWKSRKGWFFLVLRGEIYSFMLDMGRFSVSIESKLDEKAA